ncbi:class I SAM-dependent methyltransferase [Amycolatopsis suaedae]|uniref:Class I SAM-dependent methyltransferase n=1 Tax=Amycolatopsis suaedae TaxID=2510978 RepID=A0A4Q7JEC4_9PSEU|nr:class I SAM-dependent methyltransferase [Amycolatopsis suaedae]
MNATERLAEALAAVRAGDRRKAAELADSADCPLGTELALHLRGSAGREVYSQPDAFTAFIRGGQNVALYEALADRLAARYAELTVSTLLDVGCGDGMALVPALERATTRPATVGLIEPSEALLTAAVERLAGLPVEVRSWGTGVLEYLAADAGKWTLAQSTFALQSLPPDARLAALRGLRERCDAVLIAEFDIPDIDVDSDEYLTSLARRYQRGLEQYPDNARLVAQGFLLPMLLGQAAPLTGANNWEQPAAAWVDQLRAAGFTEVSVEPLAEYWWSPAVVVNAA